MARWNVYCEYGYDSFETEVDDDDLETEDQVIADVLENIQIWATKVEED
jgi:hypothetical protein